MWILIALLLAPPMDVTAHMQAAPGVISLNLKKNLLLGDTRGTTLTTLAQHLPAIEGCLAKLRPVLMKGMAPTSMNLSLTAAGAVERMSVHASVDGCLRPVLDGIRFEAGRKRFGMIKLRVAEAPQAPVPAKTDAVRWAAKGESMDFLTTARRVPDADGAWRLALETRITAHAPRGVGASTLRHNSSLLLADGRVKNAVSRQTSASVDQCLTPGAVFTQSAQGAHPVQRGEMYSAQVFILAGDCTTGEGRYEIGTVQLDGRRAWPPVLRVMPTWAYQVFSRHR